ncbi:MAG: ATPase, T2SS/T4P/T4SS family, partial [Lysobacteraceae bacterium]
MGITGIIRRLAMDGVLTEADARRAQDEAGKERKPIPVWLMEKRLASAAQIAAANSLEFGMPLFDVTSMDLRQAPTKLVSEQTMTTHQVLPLFKRGTRLYVGLADPTNTRGLDDVKFQTNLFTEAILVDADQLRRGIETALMATDSFDAGGEDDEGLADLESSTGDDDEDAGGGVDAKGDDTPVVKFVNKMLVDAIKRGASDVHFEPYESEYRVRYRMDGILRTVAKPPVKLNPRISSRLKVMSGLDIAERRVPQDGRIKLNLSRNKAMDFRVSTCPTLFGEKIVLRILDGSAAKLGIDMLGYEDDQKQLFLDAIAKPYGMVLVTGPTGSGKTVSLYTALNILNTDARNISTVEDPVEIRVPGINQVQQNAKRGMTFSVALRSFLRQDPDVVM